MIDWPLRSRYRLSTLLLVTLVYIGITPAVQAVDTDCVGCPYIADGECVIRPKQYGYYMTTWRRWPGIVDTRFPGTNGPSPISEDVPATQIPVPADEGDLQLRPAHLA